MKARGDRIFHLGENTECLTHRTYLGGETARDEVNSTREGAVVTMGIETVSLEVVSRLITGVGYIVLIPTDPKDAVVTTVVLRKERIEYWRILTSSMGQKCLTKLWSLITISLHDMTIKDTKDKELLKFY